MSQRIQVRGVNGDGPTCGCGGHSALHVIDGPRAGDYFLCRVCVVAAVTAYLTRVGQVDQGPPPGDYATRLYAREHNDGAHERRRQRWCPHCEASTETHETPERS